VKSEYADLIEQRLGPPQHIAVHPAAIGAKPFPALGCHRHIAERITARLWHSALEVRKFIHIFSRHRLGNPVL